MSDERNLVEEGILLSIRDMLDSDSYFDPQLIIHINTAFSILSDLGVGPDDGFMITGETETWSDYLNYIEDNKKIFNMVKSYMVIKVKLLFDTSSMQPSAIQLMKDEADEYEWRLRTEAELIKRNS